MERDTLNELWKQWCDTRIADVDLPSEELMSMIQSRANDVRRRVIRRLRREISAYVICIVSCLPLYLSNPSLKAIGFLSVIAALEGVLILVLHHNSRAVAMAPSSGSTLQWIDELSTRLALASRAYLSAYMIFVTISVGLIAFVVATRTSRLWPYVVVAAAIGVVALVYRSGVRYVECLFGRYRNELLGYRQQLLEQ